MKNYEVIVERQQPSCGGKSPKDVKVMNVATDDPMAYVRTLEKDGELESSVNANGELVISLELGARRIKYTFSEE